MKKQIIKNLILVILTCAITALSIWLPGDLMHRNQRNLYSTVNDVPSQYYSAPSEVIIKNASRQLTKEQCIQLITGEWKSNIRKTDESACNLNEFGIKTVVATRVEDLHSKGMYPVSISPGFDKWYTWSATPFRALDTTFETYAAIFWDIRFIKYDNSESHRFIATESGDILYAEVHILDSSKTDKSENDNTKNDKAVENNTSSSSDNSSTAATVTDASAKELTDFDDFEPQMFNCSYLLYYYGEYVNTSYNTGNFRTVLHDNQTTSYNTRNATDKQKEKLDTKAASSYVPDFTGFEPDDVYSLVQSPGYSEINNAIRYMVSYKKTSDTYQLLLQPQID